jgi:hypothetical protein
MKMVPSPNILILVWMLPEFVNVCTAFVTPVAVRSSHDGGVLSEQTETPWMKLQRPQQFRSSPTASVSQLHMGGTSIMDRLSRVVKSNVNKWVSNIENPEKVINQSVNDLQVCLYMHLVDPPVLLLLMLEQFS